MTSTTVILLNNLERAGLIERRSDLNDKRKFRIFLTKKGRQLEKMLVPKAEYFNSTTLHGISTSHMAIFHEVLDTIERNLEDQIA